MTRNRQILLATTLGVVTLVTACSSAVPTETPGVERLGQYILREEIPSATVILGYKYAEQSLGNEWLILEIAATSPQGESARFTRDGTWVRLPSGTQVQLASQKAFNEAWGTMRNQVSQANVVRDPMDYFPPNRLPCTIDYFVAPGEGVSFDEFTVNYRRACQGKLFFYIPGGTKPGQYVLGMELEEDEIRIPFVLGEG